MIGVDHPALALLRDTLAATRPDPDPRLRAEEVAKLLGHALHATGYQLVKAAPADLHIPHNHKDADDLHWHTCPACALIEGYYRGASDRTPPGSGASSIAEERLRQIHDEGWTPEHDDAEHLAGDLLGSGIAYAIYAWWQVARDASGNPSGWTQAQVDEIVGEQWWPWDERDWKPSDDATRNLAKAGALIAAEIDRARRNR